VKSWDDIWKYYKSNFLGRRLKQAQAKTLARIVDMIGLPKDCKIIDVGCGSGSTLVMFRNLGYFDSIGIDSSPHSLEICCKSFAFEEGKDTYLMDARNIGFPDSSFDLLFSDGMLEHVEDALRLVSELCRLSRHYILLFQPNQSSLFGRIKWLWYKTGRASWEKEYSYCKKDYVHMLAEFGFDLIASGSINLQEEMWLLFSRERLPTK
jgi:SAM-dependent methyltransferase